MGWCKRVVTVCTGFCVKHMRNMRIIILQSNTNFFSNQNHQLSNIIENKNMKIWIQILIDGGWSVNESYGKFNTINGIVSTRAGVHGQKVLMKEGRKKYSFTDKMLTSKAPSLVGTSKREICLLACISFSFNMPILRHISRR